MKRVVILFVAALLCLSSNGQSLSAIRDSLEAHYGFACVQSNDRGIWFLVGIPSDSDKKKLEKNKILHYTDGYPYWYDGKKFSPAEFKLGICNIQGKEIIAPKYTVSVSTIGVKNIFGNISYPPVCFFQLPKRDDDSYFVLEDGTKMDFDGNIVAPDEASDSEASMALASYLEEISDTLEKQEGKYIGRKADTLSVYSETGRIIAQFRDTTGCQKVTVKDDLFYVTSEDKDRTFYDFTGKEIFPKGKYWAVDVCWFGYIVWDKNFRKGLVSFEGKELIPCRFTSIEPDGGHLRVNGYTAFYTFDGRFICNAANVYSSDGLVTSFGWKNSAVICNSSHTKFAIVNTFGDYVLPFTDCSYIGYKDGSYRLYQKVKNGNARKYELGINSYGRKIGEAKEVGKFGYHLLNGVMGFATGLAVVATAGTALIAGATPNTSSAGTYNPQNLQTGANTGGYTTNMATSTQAAPSDGITGSNFQNYERAYDGHANTLSKMYYGQYLYSDSERSNIQREMRNIREKVNSQNQRRKIAQSSWETWGGTSKYLKMK